MLRKVVAAAAGVLAGGIAIAIVQAIAHSVYAPPPGFDPKDPEAVAALMAAMPLGAFLMVALSYALGSLVAGLVATLACRRASLGPALAAGAVLTAMGVLNVVLIPHPAWFVALTLALFVPLAWLGGRLVRRPAAA